MELKRRLLAIVGVVLLFGGCWMGRQGTPGASRSYQAARTADAPTIDGRLDEIAWADAPMTELYVGAWLEEPHLWGTLTDRDAIIYHDHDFEVFLDPDGDGEAYFEIEINVLGTEFDLFLNRPYSRGGQADIAWNLKGLRTAVFADGTINDASDIDRGWGIEMAIPWSGLVPP
ncbi:MAG: carbohydrate-binding family 9-like protein, partial [Deltaproteobacteria bacterium]|nr:carbohydrate-binding family 9-like protein [Deltaproteobacteria bacterium]